MEKTEIGLEGKLRKRFKGMQKYTMSFPCHEFKLNYLQTEKQDLCKKNRECLDSASGGQREKGKKCRLLLFADEFTRSNFKTL